MADFLGRESDNAEKRKRANELDRCGAYLVFRYFQKLDYVQLHAARFCQQDKLCPLCAIRRGVKLMRRYVDRVRAVLLEDHQLKPFMVTTTVKNGPDLAERFEHHRRALRRLLERRKTHKHGLRSTTAMACAAGGVMSYEFKRGEGSKSWHPHNHAIWLSHEQPGNVQLAREWKELTGDSFIVDVRRFHYDRMNLPPTVENMVGDFCEVFKYALKFCSMDLADNWHAFDVLRGRRLISSFGNLYGVEVPEDLLDAPPDVEDLPFVEWMFRYCKIGHIYR